MAMIVDELHTCNVCLKTCKTKTERWVHFWFHTGKNPYECTECNKIFFGGKKTTFVYQQHNWREAFILQEFIGELTFNIDNHSNIERSRVKYSWHTV